MSSGVTMWLGLEPSQAKPGAGCLASGSEKGGVHKLLILNSAHQGTYTC